MPNAHGCHQRVDFHVTMFWSPPAKNSLTRKGRRPFRRAPSAFDSRPNTVAVDEGDAERRIRAGYDTPPFDLVVMVEGDRDAVTEISSAGNRPRCG